MDLITRFEKDAWVKEEIVVDISRLQTDVRCGRPEPACRLGGKWVVGMGQAIMATADCVISFADHGLWICGSRLQK
jgi:hypothetical protein